MLNLDQLLPETKAISEIDYISIVVGDMEGYDAQIALRNGRRYDNEPTVYTEQYKMGFRTEIGDGVIFHIDKNYATAIRGTNTGIPDASEKVTLAARLSGILAHLISIQKYAPEALFSGSLTLPDSSHYPRAFQKSRMRRTPFVCRLEVINHRLTNKRSSSWMLPQMLTGS